MGFFSRFATTFNELSNATFNTLIVKAHKQSNEVNKEYVQLLQDPEFRTTQEVATILSMSAEEARKEMKVGAYAEVKPEENKPETQPETKPEAN